MTCKLIAKELGVSPHTIDTYIRRIYAKFGVHSRSAAVLRFVKCRLPIT